VGINEELDNLRQELEDLQDPENKTKSKKKVKSVTMDEITRGNVFCAQLRKKANA